MIFFMDQPEVARVARIADRPRTLPSIEDLRTWDWRDELRRQERSLRWLARKTGRSQTTLNRYISGERSVPASFLLAAADALGLEVREDDALSLVFGAA